MQRTSTKHTGRVSEHRAVLLPLVIHHQTTNKTSHFPCFVTFSRHTSTSSFFLLPLLQPLFFSRLFSFLLLPRFLPSSSSPLHCQQCFSPFLPLHSTPSSNTQTHTHTHTHTPQSSKGRKGRRKRAKDKCTHSIDDTQNNLKTHEPHKANKKAQTENRHGTSACCVGWVEGGAG